MYKGLQIQWERRFHQRLQLSAFPIPFRRAWITGRITATSCPIPTTRAICGVPPNTTSATLSSINYIYALPFLKNNKELTGKMLGGWSLAGTAQFQTGTPCGIGTNNDFAGAGEYGSFGCGSEGQFWVLNSPPTINTGAFAGPVTNSSSPKYFTVNATAPPTGTFNLSARRPRFHLPARLPGLEPVAVQDLPHQRAGWLPVPRRVIRLPQPSEPERAESQSHVQPVRHDHQQDRLEPRDAAFLAALLLRRALSIQPAANPSTRMPPALPFLPARFRVGAPPIRPHAPLPIGPAPESASPAKARAGSVNTLPAKAPRHRLCG